MIKRLVNDSNTDFLNFIPQIKIKKILFPNMTSISFADILERHFKMNKDYSLDLVLDLLQAEKVLFIF